MSGVAKRPAHGRRALDHGRPTSYFHTIMNEMEDTMPAPSLNLFAAPDAGADDRVRGRWPGPLTVDRDRHRTPSLLSDADADPVSDPDADPDPDPDRHSTRPNHPGRSLTEEVPQGSGLLGRFRTETPEEAPFLIVL